MENKTIGVLGRLGELQQRLKVPKNQYNDFGKYRYRSCEDIVEAVKPLLGDCILTLADEVVQVGERYYIKATAKLSKSKGIENVSCSAYAREPFEKKGMDGSQLTGTASSYARKYALGGLLLIDDIKDTDALPPSSEKDVKKASTGNVKPAPAEDEKESRMREDCKTELLTRTKGDIPEASNLLEEMTQFKGREGEMVKGLRSCDGLKGTRLRILHSKMFPKLKASGDSFSNASEEKKAESVMPNFMKEE